MTSTKSKLLSVKDGIDIASGYEPPLDYTFMCLTAASDCLEEEPRDGSTSPRKQRNVNGEVKGVTKRRTNAIRLSNNVITDWSDFTSTVEKLVENPVDIEWIDLSFNDLTAIDKCILQFVNLKVLYLHGNSIEKISEVDKLSKLNQLKSVTLHGNPVEDSHKGYRQYVLSKLPLIKNFDFSGITKSDRACSQTWSEMYKSKSKKKAT